MTDQSRAVEPPIDKRVQELEAALNDIRDYAFVSNGKCHFDHA